MAIKPASDYASLRWVADHIHRLSEEGSGEFIVVGVEHEVRRGLPLLEWVLTAAPGFRISIRSAYRIFEEGDRRLLEPLEIIRDADDAVAVRVPAADTGDRLLAVVRLSAPKGQSMPEDVKKVVGSQPR